MSKRVLNICNRCNHHWFQHKDTTISRYCPKCKSVLWNRPRKLCSKGKTYSLVLNERTNNPCATLQQIANKVGVTRERVRQLLNKGSKPTRHYIQKYHCNQCGKLSRNKLFCSRECRKIYTTSHNYVELECDICHKIFKRISYTVKRDLLKHKHIFCSRNCFNARYGKIYHSKYESFIPNIIKLLKQNKTLYYCIKKFNIDSGNYPIIKRLLAKHEYTYTPQPCCKHIERIPPSFKINILSQHSKIRWLAHLNFTEKEIKQMTHCSSSSYYRAVYKGVGRS